MSLAIDVVSVISCKRDQLRESSSNPFILSVCPLLSLFKGLDRNNMAYRLFFSVFPWGLTSQSMRSEWFSKIWVPALKLDPGNRLLLWGSPSWSSTFLSSLWRWELDTFGLLSHPYLMWWVLFALNISKAKKKLKAYFLLTLPKKVTV